MITHGQNITVHTAGIQLATHDIDTESNYYKYQANHFRLAHSSVLELPPTYIKIKAIHEIRIAFDELNGVHFLQYSNFLQLLCISIC